MKQSISFHFICSELNLNDYVAIRSISKITGFLKRFRPLPQFLVPQFLVPSESLKYFSRNLSQQSQLTTDRTVNVVMYHQSYQIKPRKYYRYSLEKANFSKSSGKGPKVKGQILKLSNASLWNEYSGILLFLVIFHGFSGPRTLMFTR